jgi:hypothetical protein
VKPSPVPSILLFIGTAILAFSLFGKGWYSHSDETVQMSGGPLWSSICIDMGEGMKCETHTIFSGGGGMNIFRILGILFVFTALSGTVVMGIAGGMLLKKQRSALALVTVILLGVATLIELGSFLVGVSKGGMRDLPGYGFFLYFIGATLGFVGAIMAMRRGGPAPAPYPYPMPYPAGPPGPQYGYSAQPPMYPPQQPPAYAPPPAYPPVAAAPHGPMEGAAQAPQAGPPHVCGAPMTWAAQYGRWFCPRCNQYG